MILHGLKVLVTRPKPQGEELCNKIREQGGQAVYFPVMDILPTENIEKIKQDIARLAEYDIVIFVSLHAVLHSQKLIHALWPVFPSHIQVMAIGKKTADALNFLHLPVHHYPSDNWNSEALLTSPGLLDVQGKKIAIIRGETGREVLAEELTRRGAHVDNMIAYRRVVTKVDVQPYKNLIHAHEIDIIICTSNEILQNLTNLLTVQQVPLMVISERMLCFAKKLGFKHLYLANNASHDAIIVELAKHKETLCQMKKTKI
jgi:uroporphyrinogen-III synthase